MGLVLITLAGGVACTGLQLYRSQTRQKKCAPFIRPRQKTLGVTFSSRLRRSRGLSLTLFPLHYRPEPRQGKYPNAEEKAVNRNFKISSFALVLSTGSLVYPPLLFVSLSGVAYGAKSVFQRAYRDLIHNKRITWSTIESLMFVGLFGLRRYYLLCVDAWLIALSHKLLSRTKASSYSKLVNLFGEQPRSVWVQHEQVEVELPIEQLHAGDHIIVHTGEMIPADGRIVSGAAHIDQQMLTGESQFIEKTIGETVFASTLLQSGTLEICVEKAGRDTTAARIGEIWQHTAAYTSSVQLRAERLAERCALPVLTLSAATFPFLGATSAVGVLLACPGTYERVLGPLGLLNFFRIASHQSILIKDGRALELLRNVDTVVFDKTGTLTLEQPQVTHIYPCSGYQAEDVLAYAAAAESKQSHPIAQAVVQAASQRDVFVPSVTNAQYTVGYGLTVQVADRLIRVGSQRFMLQEGIAIPPSMTESQSLGQAGGTSFVFVAIDDQLGGLLELQSTLRPEALAVVQDLQRRNVSLAILSGDRQQPTQELAQALGIDQYFAEVLPEEKAALIGQLQSEGRSVCFIGDGINDAIALKQAHVSMSLCGASSLATDTAQIILMDQTLSQLPAVFDLAQQLHTNMTRTMFLTLLANATSIAGVYAFHLGLLPLLLISYSGMIAGSMNTVAPLLQNTTQPSQGRS